MKIQQCNREVFIDLVKGFAIISVILLHALPPKVLDFIQPDLWIGQAVPFFLFIQVYNACRSLSKKGVHNYFSQSSIKKMINRIFVPFLMVGILQIFILTTLHRFNWIDFLMQGFAFGPGSYYPWIFLQFWILIPFVYLLYKRWGRRNCFIIVLLLNIIAEYLCAYYNISEQVYRLLSVRYLFLIYLGIDFYLKKIDRLFLGLSCFSVIYLLNSQSSILLDSNWLYPSWNGQHWPAYFYTYTCVCIIKTKINLPKFICDKIIILGERSWYIYIYQMFIFWGLPFVYPLVSPIFNNNIMLKLAFLIFIILLNLSPFVILKKKQ